MAHTEQHPAGVVSWIEVATSDQDGAKAFYGSLMNWTHTDSPVQGGVYTTFLLKGRKVGAGYTMMPDEAAMGIPPHWNVYFAVESADTAASLAQELGGKVLAGPFDVMEHGRMAVIQDPTGAVFCVWQAKAHAGVEVKNEAGSLCWVDLNSPEREAASKFYKQLFGWELEPGDGDYWHIKAGEQYIGGMPSGDQLPPNAPPHWLVYLQVDDCDASSNKAKELGANVCFGPMSIEKVGRLSVITDPQGAALSLFQPFPRA